MGRPISTVGGRISTSATVSCRRAKCIFNPSRLKQDDGVGNGAINKAVRKRRFRQGGSRGKREGNARDAGSRPGLIPQPHRDTSGTQRSPGGLRPYQGSFKSKRRIGHHFLAATRRHPTGLHSPCSHTSTASGTTGYPNRCLTPHVSTTVGFVRGKNPCGKHRRRSTRPRCGKSESGQSEIMSVYRLNSGCGKQARGLNDACNIERLLSLSRAVWREMQTAGPIEGGKKSEERKGAPVRPPARRIAGGHSPERIAGIRSGRLAKPAVATLGVTSSFVLAEKAGRQVE